MEKAIILEGKNKAYVEKYIGNIDDLFDDDAAAVTIAEELGEFERGDEIERAWWATEDCIKYEICDEQETDEDDEPRAFTEGYLNTIGMSLRDFA